MQCWNYTLFDYFVNESLDTKTIILEKKYLRTWMTRADWLPLIVNIFVIENMKSRQKKNVFKIVHYKKKKNFLCRVPILGHPVYVVWLNYLYKTCISGLGHPAYVIWFNYLLYRQIQYFLLVFLFHWLYLYIFAKKFRCVTDLLKYFLLTDHQFY